QLLRELVRPLVDDVIKSGDAEQWFFIRYGDPFWHIRLRFRGSPERLHGRLLPTFNAAVETFVSAGKVWRVQLDTYEREVERYGGAEGILRAERIFHADSEAVLSVVGGSAGNEGLEARRLIALRGIDRLLDDFGLDLALKLRVAESLCDEFGGRLSADRSFNRRLGTAYRNRRGTIEGVLDGASDARPEFAREFAALERRSRQTSSAIAELKNLAGAGRLSVPLRRLVSGLVHMHANRILRPAQRNEESLLYHLLARFYRSRAARGRT
ncbi:MAG TPA: thiopeptide-type bacteriocin biosynthesis protein, partial [Pyrinomonadaceae bacterium]